MNILLQILDEGKINDSQGRSVSFENTVIVMTSNAGSDKNMGPLGFGKNELEITEEKARKALAEFLRPEFLSRINEIVVFKKLNKNILIQIAELKLNEFIAHLKEKGINLTYENHVPEFIINKIDDINKNGAREIDNLICKNIIDKLAEIIISRSTLNLGQVLLKNDLSFEIKNQIY